MSRPADQKAREAIIQDLDHSMLVEAGAGSGKTKSLVDRMVALIASDRCGVETMAAVTFTRKAAAELQSRFQIELERVFRKETDLEKKRLFEQALQRLDHLFAGTIHSFCARLLRERPIEAGLDPCFQELEEYENQLLMDRCWAEYLDRLYAERSPLLSQLDELDFSQPGDLHPTYVRLCLFPEVETVTAEISSPDFSPEKKQLKTYLDSAFQSLPRTVPEKDWDGLQKALRRAFYLNRNLDIAMDRHFISILIALDRTGNIVQNRWNDKALAKKEKERFEVFKENVVLPCLKRWREYCHPFIMRCALQGVEYFQSEREKQSLMNFEDLLLKAAELLRNYPEVRRYFQRRFTHILVDEFQDTDPIQAEVLLYLTGMDVEQRSWQNLRVRPGALFVVGDPKQSIYRFRRADIDIYNQVKRMIQDSQGRVLPLTSNFRSLPSICQWVNPIFKEKLPQAATRFQAAFERLVPHRTEQGGGVRRIVIDTVERHNQAEIARQDAVRVASWIAQARKGAVREMKGEISPGDVMILLRYKAHLSVYARELEAMNIPYEISGGGAFGQSEEIRQLLNLLDAVAEPADEIALVAALRGQFFGISDDMLYRFRCGGGHFSYIENDQHCRDEEAWGILNEAFEQLRLFHDWTRKRPAGAALCCILDVLGIVPLALTKDKGESRAGNVMKVLELIMTDRSGCLLTFSDMVDRRREFAEELEVEEMSIEPGRPDAVRIMNLHKAKGLEAKVIFLADPVKDTQHDPDVHIARHGDQATGYFVAWQSVSEYQSQIIGLPPEWEQYEALETQYAKAEEDRLLYVAATRARELLVVSTYPEKAEIGAWKDLYPYLQDVEELRTEPITPPCLSQGRVSPDDFAAGRLLIRESYSTCKARSYDVESVTQSVSDTPETGTFSRDSGKGMSWGTVIHAMLETAGRDAGADLDLVARNLLKEQERSLVEADEAVRLVISVMSSELWDRMKKAEQSVFEVPFSLQVEDQPVPKVMTGVIDLAFKEPDGWVIADYKTDRVDGNIKFLVDHYRPQIEYYRRFLEQASREKVKEAGLFFVSDDKWVTI